MPLKSSRPLLMCDLDLSISKEVVKPSGKNDFRAKMPSILRGSRYLIESILMSKSDLFQKKSPRFLRGDFDY